MLELVGKHYRKKNPVPKFDRPPIKRTVTMVKKFKS